MKQFMGEDFLLTTETAEHLYHDYASKMPIIDYHCHLNPREIYEDIQYENITQLWLGADHYKWRQMRSNGVVERFITGDASDYEKFEKWAQTLELAIGNPLYHWSHLELKRYFGYEGCLNSQTAETVWNLCNEKLQTPQMSARNLILQSGVEAICTTDDPADTLEWHIKLREEGFPVKVLPTFRPDKAMYIEKADYVEYLEKLATAAGVQITTFEELIEALRIRMAFFAQNGCVVSDHGLPYVMYEPYVPDQIQLIFKKALKHEPITSHEEMQFKTAFMVAMGREYQKKNWVMQLHFGVQRDLNQSIFNRCGADAGIDAIGDATSAVQLGKYLNALVITEQLPKTILYSLNPIDNAAIDTVMGCFQDSDTIGKIQHGSAWWFNDHKSGMVEQMTSLANLGLLANFVGMLTDSRSFLSYARHEYFRRILCDLIGTWVENGEYPNDEQALKKIVEGISYLNTKRYFGL